MKFIFAIFLMGSILFSCKKDKAMNGDIYVGFEYNGPKIDSSSTEGDRVIFTNFDGSPVINVPNATPNACDSPIYFGNHTIGDTLKWHLRLVPSDGGPQVFQIYIDPDGYPQFIQDSIGFYNPGNYNFVVEFKECADKNIIVIHD